MPITSSSIISILHEDDPERRIAIRICGTRYVLLEYIPTSLNLRRRVHLNWVEQALREMNPDGLLEITGGVCSLLITYDHLRLSSDHLIKIIELAEEIACQHGDDAIASRIVRLPIAFHDSSTLTCMKKYTETVRADAPNLPDNMEFIARCNGLSSIEEVERVVESTQYLVLGLGDVYMGAPCAVPLNPNAKLPVPKYSPARIYTPEGAVGLAGVFLCIYSTESPGGYQLIGRTVPIWSPHQIGDGFAKAPWLLRSFDRVQFYGVTEKELTAFRTAARTGDYHYQIEDGQFRLKDYGL